MRREWRAILRREWRAILFGVILYSLAGWLIQHLVSEQRRVVAACEKRGGYAVVTRATTLCLDPRALK
jgi:hypothetical protein